MTFAFRSFRAVFLLLMMTAVAISAIPAAHAQARKSATAASAKEARARKANEDRVRQGVAAFFVMPESEVESVTLVPQGGLYEVVLSSGELIYADRTVSFLILGNIIDTKTRKNLTRERRNELSNIDFKSLPLERAIKRVNGNGQRVIVTFEDPLCTYCRHLGQELQKVKNVTVYTFLYPMLSADSAVKSRHIWCARDKVAAWATWIAEGRVPQARDCDDSAVVESNMALGKKLRVNSVPALFFTNGTRAVGYYEAADLEQMLEEVAAEAKAKADE